MVLHSPVTLGSVVVPTRCIGITVRNSLTNAHLYYRVAPTRCAHAGILVTIESMALSRRATANSAHCATCALFSVSAQHRIPFTRQGVYLATLRA